MSRLQSFLQLAGDAGKELVRSVAIALAPFGDGRMDDGAAHFYGSFLLELSFDPGFATTDTRPASTLDMSFLPSPSMLWVLQQSFSARPSPQIDPAQPSNTTSETVLDVYRSGGPVVPTDAVSKPAEGSSSNAVVDFGPSTSPQINDTVTEVLRDFTHTFDPRRSDMMGIQDDFAASQPFPGAAHPGTASHFDEAYVDSNLANLEHVISGETEHVAGGLREAPPLEVQWPWLFE